jgi:hypothetical protein
MKNLSGMSNVNGNQHFSKKWKIFISHTSELSSLEGSSYVDKAINAVRTRHHIPVEMRDFPPQCERPDDYDAKQVKECDVYIGILGMKYGSLTSKGISHTESEYQAAVEHGIPRLIFLLNENSRHLELTANDLKPGKYAKKLSEFKKRVNNSHLVKYVDSPNDLEKWINHGLEALEKKPMNTIDQNKFQEQLGSNYLTPIPFGLYLSERSTDFWGRKWLFDKVKDWATKNYKKDKSLLLTADYGVGKTAFMAQLVQNNLSGLPLAAMHFCQGRDEETLSPGRFVQSIAAQLQRVLPAYHDALQETHLKTYLEHANSKPIPAWKYAVVEPLHRIATPDSRWLVVVDALDVALHHRPAPEDAAVTIVELLAEEYFLPSWLRVLATSRNIDDVTKILQERFENYNFGDDNNNKQDLREYISHRCQSKTLSAKLVQANIKSEEVVSYLCGSDENNANFYFAFLLLDAIEHGHITLKNMNDLRQLPPKLDNFYSRYFDTHIQKDNYTSVQAILGVLCEAREPLGLDELAAIMEQSKNEVSECLRPLDALLTKRKHQFNQLGESIDKRLSFSHFSVSQWLCDLDKFNKYCVNRDDAYKRLSRWALSSVKSNNVHKWPYLVRHLSNYLEEHQRPLVMVKLLKSFEWIQARFNHIRIMPVLINDFHMYSSNGTDTTLIMLQRALGQSEQILRSYPEQLSSQLLARLEQHGKHEEIGAILQAAQQQALHDGQVVPLTPSLFNPQLTRSNILPIQCKHEVDVKVTCLCLSDDIVLFGLNDGRICSWSLSTGNFSCSDESEDKTHISPVSAIVLLPNKGCFASASGDKIILWKLPGLSNSSFLFYKKLDGSKTIVNSLLAFPYRNSYFLVSALDDQIDRLRVWDIDNDKDYYLPFDFVDAYPDEKEIAYLTVLSQDKFASLSKDGLVRKWNLRTKTSEPPQPAKLKDATASQDAIITHIVNQSVKSLHVICRSIGDKLSKSYVIDFDSRQKFDVKELDSWAPDNLHSFLSLDDGTIYYSLNDSALITCRTANTEQKSVLEMGYNDSPLHCLSLSSNKCSLVTASIKKSVDLNNLVTIAIWDALITPTPLHQPHRRPVAWITTLDDEMIIYSFATDGSVCIWDTNNPREPKTRFKLKDFKETELDSNLRFDYFNLGDLKFAVRNGGGLHLYEIPSVTTEELESQPFNHYDIAKSDYAPCVVINHDQYKTIFGCQDGQVIYNLQNSPREPFEKFTAVNKGLVGFMMQIDKDNLLCWSSEPNTEQIFVICNLKKPKNLLVPTTSYIIDPVNLDQSVTFGDEEGASFFRPLRVWENDNCIAIAHSNFMVTIWEWTPNNNKLKLVKKLSGHTNIVSDIEVLKNNLFVTISWDKTIRVWDDSLKISESCCPKVIFTGDYAFTSLYLCNNSNTIIVGDEMGNVHWLKVS